MSPERLNLYSEVLKNYGDLQEMKNRIIVSRSAVYIEIILQNIHRKAIVKVNYDWFKL